MKRKLHGMTWYGVAAKKNKPKKGKDYIMIIVRHVCSFPEARWFWLYE